MKTRKQVVVDSSVIIKWVNSQDENLLKHADNILKDTEKEKIEIFAPELAKYEIGNALLNKKMELSTTKVSLSTVYAIPITFIPLDEVSAKHTMEIAWKSGITYYDASFIALAEKLKAEIITDNPKHLKKSLTTEAKVVALKDYK